MLAKHVTLLLIGSSHALLDVLCAAPLQNSRLFQQPAKAYEALREAKPTKSLISVYPEDALWKMVKTQAKKDNRSMAAMVCEILRRYFVEHPK